MVKRKTGGGVGTNQYQVRGRSTAQDRPHTDLLAQVDPAHSQALGKMRLIERYHIWRLRKRWDHLIAAQGSTFNDPKLVETIQRLRSPAALDRVAHSTELAAVQEVASHPNLAPQTMEYLVSADNTATNMRLARRADLPQSIAMRLAQNSHWLVRSEVATNTPIPEVVVYILKTEQLGSVRKCALNNPNCPPHIRALAAEL